MLITVQGLTGITKGKNKYLLSDWFTRGGGEENVEREERERLES